METHLLSSLLAFLLLSSLTVIVRTDFQVSLCDSQIHGEIVEYISLQFPSQVFKSKFN